MSSNNNKNNNNNKKTWIIAFFASGALLAFLLIFYSLTTADVQVNQKITYTEALSAAKKGEVAFAELSEYTLPKKAVLKLKKGGPKKEVILLNDHTDLLQILKMSNAQIAVVNPEEKMGQGGLISMLAAVAIIILLLFVGPGLFGDSVASVFGVEKKKKNEPGDLVKLSDVCGIDDVKEDLKEIIDFIKNQDKFIEIGAKLPKGILLVGAPGVGKTMLAKAIACEVDAHFIPCAGSDFMEMFVGVGAKRVRELFAEARAYVKNTKGGKCIIFIDEIDAVGSARDKAGYGTNTEGVQTLNALLSEMDGFDSKAGIIVIAATNREDVLDPALLRSGRFDRKLFVPLPRLQQRKDILFSYLRKYEVTEDGINTENIVKSTSEFSGADIATLVNESAFLAIKCGDKKITRWHLEQAFENMIMGKPTSLIYSEEDRYCTAIHEAGHALVIHFIREECKHPSEKPDPIYIATMIPRGMGVLGYVSHFPMGEYDVVSCTRAKYLNNIAVSLGGQVAENLIFGEERVTSGATSDIKHATKVAYNMVAKFGFSDKIGFVNPEFFVKDGLGMLSSFAQSAILEEVNSIIKIQRERVFALLSKHVKELKLVAEAMLEQDLTGDQIIAIIKDGNLDKFKAVVMEEKEQYVYFPPSSEKAEKKIDKKEDEDSSGLKDAKEDNALIEAVNNVSDVDDKKSDISLDNPNDSEESEYSLTELDSDELSSDHQNDSPAKGAKELDNKSEDQPHSKQENSKKKNKDNENNEKELKKDPNSNDKLNQ